MSARGDRTYRWGLVAVAVLLALLAVNALWDVARGAFGWNDSPPLLMVLQSVSSMLAGAAALGAWRRARWAPLLIVLYGAVTGGMIVALRPILDLPAEALPGLAISGGLVLGVCLLLAWFARRAIARPGAVRQTGA